MLDKNIKKYIQDLRIRDESYWVRTGEKMAIKLFQSAALRVPAYKDFLKSNKINPEKIKTIADFSKINPINKKNYLLYYPLEKLCWDGEIGKTDMISLSSGSSGKPFFWPRSRDQEDETALVHEAFLLDSFGIDKNSTLLIVSFAMGMWVAGTLTHRAAQSVAERYKMTVITPGINKHDILNIIKELGDKYDQIVIAGYPPFVKDIVDEGANQNLNWKKFKLKFLFAAESFSEKWRDYIYDKVGSKNPLKDSLNIYGTADSLILGHETPLSILVRRLVNDSGGNLYRDIFKHDSRVPTLIQYNPAHRYFEALNSNLIFSAFSGIPLIRYEIGDTGDIIGHAKMASHLKAYGIDLNKKAKLENISNWRLPFLYVQGRSDFTASLYGINIYPENIRDALNHKDIDKDLSGKFVMSTKNDKKMAQYLEISVELKDGVLGSRPDLNGIQRTIIDTLRAKNKEYDALYKTIKSQAEPVVKLCKYGDQDLFATGVKQKWYKKN